jgi:hypothetical protein
LWLIGMPIDVISIQERDRILQYLRSAEFPLWKMSLPSHPYGHYIAGMSTMSITRKIPLFILEK